MGADRAKAGQVAGAVLLAVLAAGCATVARRDATARPAADREPLVVRPTVAITAFEDRSGFQGEWRLGEGLAEGLSARLVESGRVTVIEPRDDRGGWVSDLTRRGREWLRPEDRPRAPPPVEARYVVRGRVTEFSIAPDASDWFATGADRRRFRRTGARVSLEVRLVESESGRVVGAFTVDARTGATPAADYPALPFGSRAFARTPLGRATERTLDRAARRLLAEIPVERWVGRVADGGVDTVVVNGGENVGLRVGDEFLVRSEGRRVTDPATGAALEARPGAVRGRIRVIEVRAASAAAAIVEGQANRGDLLDPMPAR